MVTNRRALERKLREQLERDRRAPRRRVGSDGDTIIVDPSGTACGIALALELATGEDAIAAMNRLGNDGAVS